MPEIFTLPCALKLGHFSPLGALASAPQTDDLDSFGSCLGYFLEFPAALVFLCLSNLTLVVPSSHICLFFLGKSSGSFFHFGKLFSNVTVLSHLWNSGAGSHIPLDYFILGSPTLPASQDAIFLDPFGFGSVDLSSI